MKYLLNIQGYVDNLIVWWMIWQSSNGLLSLQQTNIKKECFLLLLAYKLDESRAAYYRQKRRRGMCLKQQIMTKIGGEALRQTINNFICSIISPLFTLVNTLKKGGKREVVYLNNPYFDIFTFLSVYVG